MKMWQVKIIIGKHPPYCRFCRTFLHTVRCIAWVPIIPDDMGVPSAYRNLSSVPDIHFWSYGSKNPCTRSNGFLEPVQNHLQCRWIAFNYKWVAKVRLITSNLYHSLSWRLTSLATRTEIESSIFMDHTLFMKWSSAAALKVHITLLSKWHKRQGDGTGIYAWQK